MKKSAVLLVACMLWLGAQSDARAQVAYVTYYHPMPVFNPPVVAMPHTVYYAAAPYYAPASRVSYEPVARVCTRYRPLLGGTVTRVRYRYAPVYHPPAPVVYAY